MTTPLHGKIGAFYMAKKNALECDTISDIVTVADNSAINFAGDRTLEVWCNIDTGGYDDFIVAKGDPSVEDGGWALKVFESDAQFLTYGPTSTQSTSKINTGEWSHIVTTFTLGTNTTTLYINGETEETGTGSAISNTSDLIFGATSDATGTTKIGMVRLFDKAATAAEVSDMYKGKFPRSHMIGALKGEWMFTEGTGTALVDAGPNKLDGTISNASWVTTTYNTATAEALTSDATRTVYVLANENVEDTVGLTVTVDGVAKTKGNDFNITPKGTITFNSAVTAGEAVLATYRYYPMTLEAGGFTSWSVDHSVDTIDSTEFRNTGWREFTPTLKSWSGSADRHWLNPLNGLVGDKTILRFYTDIDNSKYYTGWGIINGLNTTTAVDTLVDEAVTFQGSGALGTQTV